MSSISDQELLGQNASLEIDESRLLVYGDIHFSGFSQVISARDLDQGRVLALKIIDFQMLRNLTQDLDFKMFKFAIANRIYREIREAKKFPPSPFLSRYFSVNWRGRGERIVVITESCKSGNIYSWVLMQEVLDQKLIRKLFMQLFSALEFFYQRSGLAINLSFERIVFRNLTQESMVILPDISVFETLNEIEGKIGRNEVIDTWPPEKLTKAKEFNECSKCHRFFAIRPFKFLPKESDIWVIGILFAFLMTGGCKPFEPTANHDNDPLQEMLTLIGEFDPEEFYQKFPALKHLSEPIREIMTHCLKTNHSSRPSVQQLIAAFDNKDNYQKWKHCVRLHDSFLTSFYEKSSRKLELFEQLTDTEIG